MGKSISIHIKEICNINNEGISIGNQSKAQLNCVSIGNNTGQTNQGDNAIAIGNNSGQTNQGDNCIAIGSNSGTNNQHPNSIIINSSNSSLNSIDPNAFYIKNINSRVLVFTGTEHPVYYNNPDKYVFYYTGV